MFRFLWMSVALLALLHSQHVMAHGTPVVISTPGGKLTVDSLLYANLTEDDVINNAPLPFGPNLQYTHPGFDITGMAAGNELNIELLPQTLTGLPDPQYLSFWSPLSGLSIAPNNQAFRVVSAFGQVTAFQDDTPVPPALKVATVTNGVIGVHTHFLNYYLDDYVNAAEGLYSLQVRLTSPQYQSSDPFWMMFDYNISGAEVVTGSNAIMAAAAGVAGSSVWQGASGGNWTAAPIWSGSVPNSASAEAQFTTTGGAIANLNVDQTVNKLTFNATTSNDYTISGPGKLTLAGTTPAISTTDENTGDQTIAVNLDLAASTLITVAGGSLSLNAPANATLGAGVTATVASGATLNLGGAGNALSNGTSTHADVTNNGTLAATTVGQRVGNVSGTGTTNVTATYATLTANHVRQAGLTIGAGNNVTVAANDTDTSVSKVTALSINATGQLDLNNNDLIVDNGNLAAVTLLLKTGLDITGSYGGGPGITSTTFATNPMQNTALGVATNAELLYPTFSGQVVDANDILVKYTYYGDADLNGVVDTATDFDLYITGLTSGGRLGGWLYGDFDYNGTVDSATDFDLYITGLTSQSGALLTAGSAPIQAVPEPGSLALAAAGLLGVGALLRRRRAINEVTR